MTDTPSNYAQQRSPTSLEIAHQLPGPIERVWDHLVDGELRKLWFCGGATADHVGGKIVLEFDHSRLSTRATPPEHEGGGRVTNEGEVLRFEPPNVFAFNWFEHDGVEHSRVTITLTEKNGGVELHLLHERLEKRTDRVSVAAGWHAHFDLLGDLLRGEPVRDFWDVHLALEKHYDDALP
ncbi:MAG: SRPBCC family protein [Pseudomonadota bacterium]